MLKSRIIAVICIGAAASVSPAPAQTHDGTHGNIHDHAHGTLRDAGQPGPTVTVTAHPDLDGFNLEILTRNFRFSPENTGLHIEAVEGHAHLYVNGTKKARIYGNWFHLPENWLTEGENTVRVSLFDNVHKAWGFGGVPVGTTLTLVREGTFNGTLIEHAFGNGPPETFRAIAGATVRLVLHADQDTKLHLHGYDLMATARPGSPAVFTFEANHAGRFAIETHGVEDLLGRTERALAYIEVRPE